MNGRNVEATLISRLFNPYNWVRLVSPTFGRSELATEVYQTLLFADATFAECFQALVGTTPSVAQNTCL